MTFAALKVRTTLFPDLDADLEGGEPGPTSWIWKLLRPRFEVVTPVGPIYSRAPWGDPGDTSWPLGAALIIAIIGFAIVALLHAGKRWL